MMMMMMKKPIILMTCAVLVFALAVLASENTSEPSECCFVFYPKMLPKRRIVSYKFTDERCPKRGVLFTMRKGSALCVDPSQQWVKNITESKEWVHTKTMESSEIESD